MATGSDITEAQETYKGFVNAVKIATPVIFVIAALVVLKLAA